METIKKASGCPVIDYLIECSLDEESELELEWIPYSEFTNIESIKHSGSDQPVYYATYEKANVYGCEYKFIEILPIGTRDECTQEFMTEFARTYSLPTHKYNNPPIQDGLGHVMR